MEGWDSEMAVGREAEWSGGGVEGRLMRGGRTSLSNDCGQHPKYTHTTSSKE